MPFQGFLERNCKSGNFTLNETTHIFDHTINMDPTPPIASFNLLIEGLIIDLCKDGLVEKAEELFLKMKGTGICPDVVVCGSLMHGLCSMCEWEEAIDQGVWPNVETCNVLVHMLCKSGKVKEKRELNRCKGMLTTTLSLKICGIKYVMKIPAPCCVQFNHIGKLDGKMQLHSGNQMTLKLSDLGQAIAGTSEMKACHFDNFWSIQTKRTENTKEMRLFGFKAAYEHVFELLDLHEFFPGILESGVKKTHRLDLSASLSLSFWMSTHHIKRHSLKEQCDQIGYKES
ncbi:hypothetical protein SADUNF_Sadunf02G0036000 [Salix dunnii]|uniref:Pentatricopeptide repeat-containing protein n=1 Tax=Salix dunnii TaxID=1413687 RepID=A0A835TFE0_9ROSI|nr:hypothetical protein SADUNF_Sadunf02G0036000 [Salix dunnii]